MKYLNKINSYFFLSLALISFSGCESDEINPSDTPVDFTTYVAVGNSLTAGYMDGALYEAGQRDSYPEILAKKFQEMGGAKGFKSPFVGNENGSINGLEDAFQNRFIPTMSGPIRKPITPGTGTSLTNVYSTGPFNNMGVPGAKSFHLLGAGYGNSAGIALRTANPHYVRFASSATSTVLGDVMTMKPTFFSLWIGNNDVLGYSTNGAYSEKDPTKIDSKLVDAITPVATFNLALGTAVATLTRDGAKGVVANIPNVTDVPYFTFITAERIQLVAPQVTGLNGLYAAYNAGVQSQVAAGKISQAEADRRTISFVLGANTPVIIDEGLTELSGLTKMRKLEPGELILLTAAPVLGTGGGTASALADQYILTKDELAEIDAATKAYNAIIKNLAQKYDLAFFDANALMNKLKTDGITYGSTKYNANFPSNQPTDAFSLDGVHPNSKGYAILANGFIAAINSKYGKSITPAEPNTVTIK
jgi:lysophospholipase L1-like esterase